MLIEMIEFMSGGDELPLFIRFGIFSIGDHTEQLRR